LGTLILEDNDINFTLHKEASENHLDFFQLSLSREAAVLDEQVPKHQA